MKVDYDEISPVTGNKSVIVEYSSPEVLSKICMDSGYTTNSQFRDDYPEFEEYLRTLPDIVANNEVVDDFGFHWFLSLINLGTCMLWPESTEDSYQWVVAPFEFSDEKNGRLVTESGVSFKKDEFEDAFAYMYGYHNRIVEEMYKNNKV